MLQLAPPAVVAPAPGADPEGAVIQPPVWVRRPSPAEIARALPPAAAADGVGGQAAIVCEIGADSRLSQCVGADPKNGYGFNAAALSLAPAFRIRPETVDGVPRRRGRVVVPIRFEPPPGEAFATGAFWVSAPIAAKIRAALPKAARQAGVGGRGVMRCTVSGELLGDCRPAGDRADSFSRAAVTLAPDFLISPTFADGRPTEGAIFDIPVIFDPPKATAAAPVLESPTPWLRKPTPAQIAATFPEAARLQGLARVDVTETCIVRPDGGLDRCRLSKEEPTGVGGAQAATRLSNVYQVTTWTPDGRPTAGAAVTLAMHWDAPPAVASPTATPEPPSPRRR